MLLNLSLEKIPKLGLENVDNKIYYPKEQEMKASPMDKVFTATIKWKHRPQRHIRYKQYAKAVNLYAKALKKRYKWDDYIGINSFVEYNGELYRISTVDLLHKMRSLKQFDELKKYFERCNIRRFETMIFKGDSAKDIGCESYDTLAEALIGHNEKVENIGEWIYE